MPYAIKAEVSDPRATAFTFTAQKSMYGGKHVAAGDTVYVFASENEGGTSCGRSPTGTMAGPRPRSTSSAIVRRRTRSPVSPMQRRTFFADTSRVDPNAALPRRRKGGEAGGRGNVEWSADLTMARWDDQEACIGSRQPSGE